MRNYISCCEGYDDQGYKVWNGNGAFFIEGDIDNPGKVLQDHVEYMLTVAKEKGKATRVVIVSLTKL